jgi:D-alanyl-D-alanine carboxypeptidase (penicillin-binding protein 5/6)
MNFNLKNIIFLLIITVSSSIYADNNTLPSTSVTAPALINKPIATPTVPDVRAKAYILIDVNSGKIIAEKNSEQKLPPASLTKMMTLYVLSNSLAHGQVHETDLVRVSKEAWQTGGSRMFIKEGDEVSIQDLMNGIIVDSGNDACVAIAEHLGGSEPGFADIMNQQAQNLGMQNSHFTDSTGLPNEEHYTTAKDLAILGRALIKDFPQYYHLYKQKWFTYNNIKQPNRNRLLWRNDNVDGIKTGHTEEAGFCLVSSAQRKNMRLIAVLLGAPSDSIRADDSARLLNYGFRFFETHELFKAEQVIKNAYIYQGKENILPVGSIQQQWVTIPKGTFENLTYEAQIIDTLTAPIKKGDTVGKLLLKSQDQIVASQPLQALQNIEKAGVIKSFIDNIKLRYTQWRHS